MYHVSWVDAWDDEAQEPVGGGRCGPAVERLEEVPDAVRWMRRQARVNGWGPGEVVVLNDDFRRVIPLAHKDSAKGEK